MKNKEFIITITIICFILGLMFNMQLKTVNKSTTTATVRNSELQAQYSELKKAYDDMQVTLAEKEKILQDYRNVETTEETVELIKQELNTALRDAGLKDVRGQGLIVTVEDSVNEAGQDTNLNNYLVHDEDLLNIVNELKSSGAEAISINDQRIVAMSSIRCAGPTILVNDEKLAPPFTIKAIGDASLLESAINMRGSYVDILKGWGIRFTITKENDIFIPKYSKTIKGKYVTIVDENVEE
ncbi:MAG: DUF881 domain-containing protein [Clostridia bacterium]|nr:DUF881 domain-containing protein [Clostridia bacterium]